MFIVTDEHPVRVSGQRGFAGAGQAEENGGFAGDRIHVGGAVHGQNVHVGHDEVHGGEHGFLDLACVLRAGDDDQMCLIVDHDGCLRVDAINLRITLEARGAEDGVIRFAIVGQLLLGGTDEQLMNEKVLRCQLIDDSELLGVNGVSTCHAIENKHFAVLQIGSQLAADGVKLFPRDGTVHFAPCDLVMDGRRIHDELVVRRTAGVLARGDHQRTGIAQGAFAAAQSRFGQLCRSEIAINRFGVNDAQLFDAIGFHVTSIASLFTTQDSKLYCDLLAANLCFSVSHAYLSLVIQL